VHQVGFIYKTVICVKKTLVWENIKFLPPGTHTGTTRHVQNVKIHHVKAEREIFYAYYGNTVINLDPLPVSRARLTVVEPALFE